MLQQTPTHPFLPTPSALNSLFAPRITLLGKHFLTLLITATLLFFFPQTTLINARAQEKSLSLLCFPRVSRTTRTHLRRPRESHRHFPERFWPILFIKESQKESHVACRMNRFHAGWFTICLECPHRAQMNPLISLQAPAGSRLPLSPQSLAR